MDVTYQSERIPFYRRQTIEKTSFSNGAVFLHYRTPHLAGCSYKIWYLAGSMYENERTQGIAHLIEHMMFRASGTLSLLEENGAEVNAFTTKESVCFELSALSKRVPDVLDRFIELVFGLAFSPEDLEKEKNVVIQELREDADDYEVTAEERLFESSFSFPLGHPIGGNAKAVRGLTPSDLRHFFEKNFNPDRMVVAFIGNLPSTYFKKQLARAFVSYGMTSPKAPWRPKLNTDLGHIQPFRKRMVRSCEVSTLLYSTIGTCYDSDYRPELALVSYYLTEGMSSVLFRKLREELGLVYSLSSYANTFIQNGNFVLSASASPENLRLIEKHFRESLEHIAHDGIPDDVLVRLKRQMMDGWELAFDDVEELNSFFSRSELYRGRLVTIRELDELVKRIDSTRIKRLVKRMISHGEAVIHVVPKK